MSGALGFLLLAKLKNQIKSIVKSPGKLIYLIAVIAIIGLTIFGAEQTEGNPYRLVRDIRELTAIITVFYTVIFVVLVNKGFHGGASMFAMPDVNFLFPAPFKPQKLLFYGLFRQIGTSLALGMFLLFQYSWLHNLYDIPYGTLLIILAGYAATVFFGQISAMVIYSFTSSDERTKKTVKIVFYALIGVFVLEAAFRFLGGSKDALARAVDAVNGAFTKLVPVSGWMGGAVSGLILNNGAYVLQGFGLSALFLIFLVCLITFKNQDYYEDVIKSTEAAQSAINARKEGVAADISPSNVKVGKTGINRGFGASTFYYKHVLEDRRSRMFILNKSGLIFSLFTVLFAFFMKDIGIPAVFIFSVYMQVFTVMLGRFNRELTKPYIYLVPEPPLKKLLYGLAQAAPSTVIEALLVFVPIAYILHLDALTAAVCIIARISFSMLFTAGNVIVERLWGGAVSKVLVMFLFFAVMIALAIPGAILAIILSSVNMLIVNEDVTIFLSLIICNIPVSVLGLYLCKDMLQYAELNQR